MVKKRSLPRLADPAVESVGYFHRLAACVRGLAGRCGAGELQASVSLRQDFWPRLHSKKARLLPADPARADRAAQYREVGVSYISYIVEEYDL